MKNFNSYNFNGKKALIRVDYNVPLNDRFEVTDDTRIRATIPTIQKILNEGGSVILMSHLGRPKGKFVDALSLKHIAKTVETMVGRHVIVASDCVGDDASKKATDLKSGEILLLENLRFHNEEEEGNLDFAGKLSGLGNVYVNDAFGTAHRAHASTAIIARFFPNDRLFGLVMEEEIKAINKAMKEGEKPFTAIIGGSKVSDKVGIIENLLNIADNILIGGAMAYTFIKASGGEVGNSRTEDDKLDLAKSLVIAAKEKGVKLLLPEDSLIAETFAEDASCTSCESSQIPSGWMGLDIGEKAIKAYKEVILNSKTILWNGPMGVFEWEKFANGTKSIALSVAEATKNHHAFSLIGGGDSVAAINKFNLNHEVSYISTGGGAMLESLEGKVLPGIAAVLDEKILEVS